MNKFSSKVRSKDLRRLLSLVLVSSLLLGACGDDSSTSDGTDEPAELTEVTVLLPFTESIFFFPIHVADEMGFFEEEGLDVTVQGTEGGPFVVQQVAAGQSEFGQTPVEPVILGYGENPTYTAVYEFFTRPTFNLYVLAESGITEFSDLQGKILGVNALQGGEILNARMMFARNDLVEGDDVRIEAVGFGPGEFEALRTGRVDALVTAREAAIFAELAEVPLRCLTCEDVRAASTVIVANGFLESNQELVAGMGRALAKASLFGQTNPGAVLEIMSTLNPDQFTDPVFAEALLDATLATVEPREPDRFGFTDVSAWETTMEGMLLPGTQSGLNEPVDLGQLISNDLVDVYNDFDRNAVIEQANEAPVYSP